MKKIIIFITLIISVSMQASANNKSLYWEYEVDRMIITNNETIMDTAEHGVGVSGQLIIGTSNFTLKGYVCDQTCTAFNEVFDIDQKIIDRKIYSISNEFYNDVILRILTLGETITVLMEIKDMTVLQTFTHVGDTMTRPADKFAEISEEDGISSVSALTNHMFN